MLAFCWLFAILFALIALADPRKLWWTLSAWQYRHPEANEPSDAANFLGRGMAAVAAFGFGVAALAMTVENSTPYDQNRLDALGRDASTEFSGEAYKYGSPGEGSIGSWLEDETGARVVVAAAGSETEDLGGGFESDSRYIDHFQLSSTEDESVRGCLTAEYDGGLFHDGPIYVTASYASGAC